MIVSSNDESHVDGSCSQTSAKPKAISGPPLPTSKTCTATTSTSSSSSTSITLQQPTNYMISDCGCRRSLSKLTPGTVQASPWIRTRVATTYFLVGQSDNNHDHLVFYKTSCNQRSWYYKISWVNSTRRSYWCMAFSRIVDNNDDDTNNHVFSMVHHNTHSQQRGLPPLLSSHCVCRSLQKKFALVLTALEKFSLWMNSWRARMAFCFRYLDLNDAVVDMVTLLEPSSSPAGLMSPLFNPLRKGIATRKGTSGDAAVIHHRKRCPVISDCSWLATRDADDDDDDETSSVDSKNTTNTNKLTTLHKWCHQVHSNKMPWSNRKHWRCWPLVVDIPINRHEHISPAPAKASRNTVFKFILCSLVISGLIWCYIIIKVCFFCHAFLLSSSFLSSFFFLLFLSFSPFFSPFLPFPFLPFFYN